MFAMMLQTPEEAQAAVVKKNFEEVVVVKTEPGTECGNFGCLALDGKGGLYALKTDTMEGHIAMVICMLQLEIILPR